MLFIRQIVCAVFQKNKNRLRLELMRLKIVKSWYTLHCQMRFQLENMRLLAISA